MLRIAPEAAPFIRQLFTSAPVSPTTTAEQRVAQRLVERGIAHPVVGELSKVEDVTVVIPVFNHAEELDTCLRAIRSADIDIPIIVVDDASTDRAIESIAADHRADLITLEVNGGPARARNIGLQSATTTFVALVDADCEPARGWLEALLPHFCDKQTAVVAPRVRAARVDPKVDPYGRDTALTALDRFQQHRTPLDMGPDARLVAHGAPLGFLPSACLVARREVLIEHAFDEDLRLGEDVDLIWRLVNSGYTVRYEPAATVYHRVRDDVRTWAHRIFDYGSAAADLDARFPGRLAPLRLNPSSAPLLVHLVNGDLAQSLYSAQTTLAGLDELLHTAGLPRQLSMTLLTRGILSDLNALGHALRREWWPIGWTAIALTPRSRSARMLAASMLIPIVYEWTRGRPSNNLISYVGLRLVEDAAYGSGVLASAIRSRNIRVLLPAIGSYRRSQRA